MTRRALWLTALLLFGALIAAPALAQDLALPAFSSKPAAGFAKRTTPSRSTMTTPSALWVTMY